MGTSQPSPSQSSFARNPEISTCDLSTGLPIQFFKCDGTSGSTAAALSSIVSAMQSMTSRAQCFSYYLSFLSLAFPLLRSECQDHLQRMGFTVRECRLPAESRNRGLVRVFPRDAPEMCVIIAQLVIVLFKDIGPRSSYTAFLRERVREMAVIVGALDSDVLIALGYEQAKLIRTIFGNVHALRKALLDSILLTAARDSGEPMAQVCKYVASGLKYADMAAVCLINDTLTCPISPVLRDPRVFHEVLNYSRAMAAVIECPNPEYSE